MNALIAAALFGAGAALSIFTGSVWWGWPGGRIQRGDNPRIFWSFVGVQTLIAIYCAAEAAKPLL
jgi:hypothetical protein